MYTVKTFGGFNSIPLEDLDEAIEWASETNLPYEIIDDDGNIVKSTVKSKKPAHLKSLKKDVWSHERNVAW
jgi:hypothetical protein